MQSITFIFVVNVRRLFLKYYRNNIFLCFRKTNNAGTLAMINYLLFHPDCGALVITSKIDLMYWIRICGLSDLISQTFLYCYVFSHVSSSALGMAMAQYFFLNVCKIQWQPIPQLSRYFSQSGHRATSPALPQSGLV